MKRLKIILQSSLFLSISLVFIVCYCVFFTKIIHYKSKYNDNETKIIGKIIDYSIDGNKLSMVIKAKEKVKVIYYISEEKEKNDLVNTLAYGKTVELEGTFKELLNNTIPNTFNYKKYLYNHHIYRQLVVSKITFLKEENFIYKIKNKLVKRADTIGTKAYMHAFILGDHSYVDSDVYETYQNNGVTHLFAVSGMHVGIFIMLLSKILSKFKHQDIIIISFLIFYMFIVGFTASVVRATLLYIFLKINKKLKLNLDTKRILYLLFLLLLIINPFYIYDLGFQYSFTTSLGLLIFCKKIKDNYLKKTFLISLIAFFFSLPITIYNFYEFNLLTVLNNIIIVPLVSVVIFPMTIITFIFPFLSSILSFLVSVLEIVSDFLNDFKFLIVIPKVSKVFIIVYYYLVYLIYKKNFKYGILLIILVLSLKLKPYLNSYNSVYFIDVGQGDASLFISSHAKDVIMIDTGGKIDYKKETWQIPENEYDFSENLATFLKSLGFNKLDLLIITHGDMDHLGYALALSEKIKIKSLMLNNNGKNAKEKELSFIPEVDSFDGENIKLLNLNSKVNNDENESSLVIYLRMGSINFLMMGDAPKSVEKEIILKYNLNVDVLKLGHHGSNTSSDYDFLKTINPKYSIISSGRNNRYNHPSAQTLESLDKLGLEYYNTQDKGTISFAFKKNKEKILFCEP